MSSLRHKELLRTKRFKEKEQNEKEEGELRESKVEAQNAQFIYK